MEDNDAYRYWLEEAKEATEEMRNEKYEKYVNEGMVELEANEKADWKTMWAVKRIFFNNYKDFLTIYLHLKDNDTHQDIVEDLEERLTKDKDINRAINRVIPRHKAKFDGLFQQDEEEDMEEVGED